MPIFSYIFVKEIKNEKHYIMRTDILKTLVANSEMSTLQKNMLQGFISRAEEDKGNYDLKRDLIEKIGKEKYIEEIIISTEDLIAYKVHPKGETDWETLYPYRFIYYKGGNWTRCNTVCHSIDVALLTFLGCKYLKDDNDFAFFASKMLGIENK